MSEQPYRPTPLEVLTKWCNRPARQWPTDGSAVHSLEVAGALHALEDAGYMVVTVFEPDNHHNAAVCPYCTPAAQLPGLIGREDFLNERLARTIQDAASRLGDYTELRWMHRGRWFEVLMGEGDCAMRVAITLDRKVGA